MSTTAATDAPRPATQRPGARHWGRRDPLVEAFRLLEVSPWRVARAIALGTLALGSAIALGGVSAWLIARASQMPPVLTLTIATVSVRAFGIGRGVFRYTERLASHDVALRGMASLRARVYRELSTAPLSRVTSVRRGDLLTRVGADVDHVGDLVVRGLIPVGVAIVVGVGTVGIMTALLPTAGAFLALGLLVAGVLGPWLTAAGARRVEADAALDRASVTASALRTLEHGAELQVAGRLTQSLGALEFADRRWRSSTDRGARAIAWGATCQMIGMGIAVLGALWFGIPAVESGQLADVALAVVVLTPLSAFEPVSVLPAAAQQVHRSREAARRLVALWEPAEPDGQATAGSPESAAPTAGLNAAVPAGVALQVSGLVAGWIPGRAVVRVDELSVPVGASVAVKGPSGAGKTTLLATLCGLVPPLAGTVAGPLTRVFTAEDAHIFETTVLENLRVARGDVTPVEAREALAAVGLEAWLDGLPAGLDTPLGADATTVSGGERRRLLLARALLSRAEMLAFDEPAEHLDPLDADALVATLLALPRTAAHVKVVLVAGHHLAAMASADITVDVDPTSAPAVAQITGGAAAAGTRSDRSLGQ